MIEDGESPQSKIEKFFIEKKLMKPNDARVYTELWFSGQQTATQLHDALHISPSTIDNIKRRLLDGGFIIETPGEGDKKKTPQYFRAADPMNIIDAHILDGVKYIQDLIGEIQADLEVERERKERGRDLTNNWLYMGHNQRISIKAISAKLSGATKNILIYGNDFDFLGHIIEVLKKKKNQVEIEILGTFDGERGAKAFDILKKNGISPVKTKVSFVPFCIVDEKEIMLGIDKSRGNYSCIYITNDYALRKFCSLFKGIKEGAK